MEGLLAAIVLAWVVASVGTSLHAMGQNKTGLWGLVVFVFGIFGLLFYAISLASE